MSNLDEISIPVASDFISPGQKASIFSWSLVGLNGRKRDSRNNEIFMYRIKKMDVIIEDSELCDKLTNKQKYTNSGEYNQMCGTLLAPGQEIILVNMLINFIKIQYFITDIE